MKSLSRFLGIIAFAVIMLFQVTGLFAQADPRPRTPQPMSTKTAMEYFRDEGLTIGINFGNTLDAVDTWTNPNRPISIETAWANPLASQAHFNGLASQGFKIVRIPVTWTGHIGPAPDYRIEEAWLRRVAEVVNMANRAGLKAFINIHHDGHHDMGGWLSISKALANRDTNTQITDQFEKVWAQIAEYFINYGDWLMFQGFNEIHVGDWGAGNAAQYRIINDWNQRFTNVVRSTGGNNANRYLLYYGYNTNSAIGIRNSPFRLPTDTAQNRQIVGFHFYNPVDFVLETTTHVWPNNSALGRQRDIDTILANFKTKFIDNGIPVIIGENGPFRYAYYTAGRGNPGFREANVQTARENRLAYVTYLYTKARENGIIPFFWETGHSFHPNNTAEGDSGLFNRNTGQPNSPESAEIIQAMMNAVR